MFDNSWKIFSKNMSLNENETFLKMFSLPFNTFTPVSFSLVRTSLKLFLTLCEATLLYYFNVFHVL